MAMHCLVIAISSASLNIYVTTFWLTLLLYYYDIVSDFSLIVIRIKGNMQQQASLLVML